MIIDSHHHAGKGDGLTGPWDTDAPLEGYLRRAHKAGITMVQIDMNYSHEIPMVIGACANDITGP